MLEPLFSVADVERSGFLASALHRELVHRPVGLVDVGARWGVSDLFAPMASALDVLAFEADDEEAKRLTIAHPAGAPWASLNVAPVALADTQRRMTLHLLAHPNNSSLYPVDEERYHRYKLRGFELVSTIELDAVPLDEIVFDPRYEAKRFGEIIKIDAQGAELDILKGAERTLCERAQCVVCEAAFFTPYTGACLFSDVELHLRARGFSFYGFLDFQHRSTKRLDKRVHRGRERFMQADAVFFHDPLERRRGGGQVDMRSAAVLFVTSLLFGFYDFSAELADLPIWEPAERARLGDVVRSLAAVPAQQVGLAVGQLASECSLNPSATLVTVGRFVDRLRDFCTYHDAR